MYYITIYLVAQKEWISKWHGIVSRRMIRLKREYASYHPRTVYFQYSVSSIIIISITSSIFWGFTGCLVNGWWMDCFFQSTWAYPWIIQHGWLGNANKQWRFIAGKIIELNVGCSAATRACVSCIGRCWGGMWSSVCHFCMTGLVFNIPNADEVT